MNYNGITLDDWRQRMEYTLDRYPPRNFTDSVTYWCEADKIIYRNVKPPPGALMEISGYEMMKAKVILEHIDKLPKIKLKDGANLNLMYPSTD
jgi:hypothetical protein